MKSQTLFVDDTIVIDCLEYCSLSFLSLALLEKEREDILFFSSQNYLLVKSELNHLKIHSSVYKEYQERVTFIFLKNKLEHDDKSFFQDFEEKVRHFEGKIIYFDRIDYFLDFKSKLSYEKALRQFKKIVQKYDKKIIFIFNSKSSLDPFLDQAFKKYATRLDFMNTDNKDQTMPALSALQDELLTENSTSQKKRAFINDESTKIQVMLVSESDELKKLHYYIFSSVKDVDYYTIDILPQDEMDILHDMDIIIYNKKENTLKKEILTRIKKMKLKTKFFEISTHPYLRQKDLLTANLDGVDKLFKQDFLMEDFIMSIEMNLKSSFYSRRLLAMEENETILISSKEYFNYKIETLLENKIFFSLLTYSYDSDVDIQSYNIQKIVREYDNIFVNKRKKEIHFIILNTLPLFANAMIKERIGNFSISLESKSSKSSFDLIFD